MKYEPTIELHRMAARAFAANKNRLPKDRGELVEWLMEFTEEAGELLARSQRAFTDHIMTCSPGHLEKIG